MIITMELPDDFHILNIGLVDAKDQHAVTRSFTKCELIEKAEYIERSEFTSFPADILDDTVPMEFGKKDNPIVDEVTDEVLKKESSHKCGDWDEKRDCCIRALNGEFECPGDERDCMFYWEKLEEEEESNG